MRKIGVISDIHGNLPALKAVLDLLDSEGCEEIIHTGDVVDIGAHSRECLDMLLARKDVTCLLGNHDRDFVVNQAEARKLSHVPTEHKRQVFASLSEQHRQRIKQFPLYVVRNCGGSKLLFCHYAFKNDLYHDNSKDQVKTDDTTRLFSACSTLEVFHRIAMPPSAEAFDGMFEQIDCDAVFFGHKHEPCDIVGNKLYVDVGSVGCHPDPKARAIIIEYDDTSWGYRRISVPYDMEETRKAMHAVACGEQLYNFYFLHNTQK